MKIQNHIFYKTLFFIYAKILIAYQFYFAYIFSLESKYFSYAFIAFYIIERCISISTIHSILNLKKIDKILIQLLGIFSCDEFYLFYRSQEYPIYLESGIQGQSLVVFFASIPNQVMCFYYSYYYPSDAFAIYGILSLCFFIIFTVLIFQNGHLEFYYKLYTNQSMLRILKEVLITSLKVLTNVSLLLLNMRSQQFLELFKYLIIILAIINVYLINQRVKFISKQKHIQFPLIYLMYMAYFFDLIIDLRQFQNYTTQCQIKIYGYSYFNKASLSSVFIKIFLLSYYLKNKVSDSKLFYTEYLVVIVAIITITIQSIRLINYIVLIDLLKPKIIEINSVKDLKNYNNDSVLNKSKYTDLKQVQLFHNEDQQQLQLYIQFIFSKFEQSEILFQSIQREHINNLRNKQIFQVRVTKPLDLSILFESLNNIIIIPYIKQICLDNIDESQKYQGLSLMIQNNVFIYLISNNSILNQEIVNEINKIKIQILTFNYLIFEFMACNPKEILYDLYS